MTASPAPRAAGRWRAGFSLIELSVVMTVLAVVFLVFASAITGIFKIAKSSRTALDRLSIQAELADQFRADVAGARSAPERWGEYTAGPHCLILEQDAERHVLYRWQDGRLRRLEQADKAQIERVLSVGGEQLLVEFDLPQEGKLLRLRLLTPRGRDGNQIVLEIIAALGGDLR